MEGSVSGRIVSGFGYSVAGNSRAGVDRLTPWYFSEKGFFLLFLLIYFSSSSLSILTFQGTGYGWILSVLQLFY